MAGKVGAFVFRAKRFVIVFLKEWEELCNL